MEPKTISDNDTGTRETSLINNEQEPDWAKENYGALADIKVATEDANGTEGTQIGDSEIIKDMTANSTAKSKIAPVPGGVTIYGLPGVHPNKSVVNAFAFTPTASGNVMAPRDYYLNTPTIKVRTDATGTLSAGLTLEERKMGAPESLTKSKLAVFSVPYGEDFFIKDAIGITANASETQAIAKSVNKSLTNLTKLSHDKAGYAKLSEVLFSKKGGVATDFSNVNSMINTGRYADSYKQGLSSALGNDAGKLNMVPAARIKTDLARQDIFGQFDYIYKVMVDGSSTKYSPSLVNWSKTNATSVLQVLMVNYMLQQQFAGTDGSYSTPISMNKWGEASLPYTLLLRSQGRASKEPFYLYCNINPSASKLKQKNKKTLPTIPVKYIEPDLAHIYALYTSIMTQVWIGASGNNVSGSTSQVWQDSMKIMNKRIKKNKRGGKNLPENANKVSKSLNDYKDNNLVSGLSTNRGKAKDHTKSVYHNTEIIGALRILLSTGESGTGKNITLTGVSHKVTNIGDTKYSKKHEAGYLFKSFKNGSADTYAKWRDMVMATKDVPLQPAIFRSNWDNSDKYAYIMMPTMLGGTAFPKSLGVLIEEMLKSKDGSKTFTNLSYANRYVMAFNFTADAKSKTSNTTGVVQVETGEKMGKATDASKPIIMTGYNGGETFSITDYFKVQDSLKSGDKMPTVTAKTTKGKTMKLKYIKLFTDFYTIPDDSYLIGDSGESIKYAKGFNKKEYKSQYKINKNKDSIKGISPNYEKFFIAK